ncbi:MAG: Crp/Fnr family transcriptional regulator [Bacteroidales bacterium]|nr:Crp/Fnr family transcriptional regulator [Bacteroidales bacterium]
MKIITEQEKGYICDITAPCFEMLSREEVEVVKASKTQLHFRKGDSLTKQGAFASYILYVINGLCRQYVEGHPDRSYNLKIVQPGDFIGLSSLFSGHFYNYSVTAITECSAFLVEKEAISGVIERNGLFGMSFIKRYSQENSALFTKINSLIFKQINGRMAETLLYLDSVKSDHPDIFNHLSRRDIADFAATSPESAVKLLKSFEKDGAIGLKDKDVEIINRKMLSDISIRG